MGFERDRRRSVRKFGERRIIRQKTLKNPISCSGVGLHSGLKVSMTLRPAAIDEGVVFKRTDIAGGGAVIPARWNHVSNTRLCTELGNGKGVSVGTVEHVLAALAGCGIDNVLIELSGPEVPIMDGSADPFVFLIECAGVVEQDAPRRILRVLKPITVTDGTSSASVMPGEGFSAVFEIQFASAAVARQAMGIGIDCSVFKKELARARTFGFLHEVQQLWQAGLARGGSLENAVVISGDRVLNEEGLRFDDEFVRHKILDAVGDLYLAGTQIIGRFHGVCSGHALTNKLLVALFADPDAWRYDTMNVAEAMAPDTSDVLPPAMAARA